MSETNMSKTLSKTLPIAVQLYSLRNLKIPFDQLLGEVAAIGYKGVETIGDHGLSAAEMQQLLDKHGLQAISTHVPLTRLEENLQQVIDFNKAIGNHTIVLPWIGQDARGTDAAAWTAFGGKLDAIGQRCADAGMSLLYHNHDFEMTVYDGKTAIEWLLDSAKPANLGWEADVAWIARGKQNISGLLSKYSGRVPRLHAKDNAPEGQGQDEYGFADVGHGVLDWARLIPAAKAAGVEWFIVEHDLPKDPIQSIRRSFEFLKSRV